MIKRGFDLLASSIGLVLLAPVMAVIAIVVRRDSEGPAIFRQERVGRWGKPFTLLKFRTMTVPKTNDGPLITSAGDSRITKVGRVLRSTKLDELPQLINVFKGDMSIVGPRPEVPKYVAMWPAEDRGVILSLRPGITDPITLRLRREEEILADAQDAEAHYVGVLLPAKIRDYREYVQTRSLALDLCLILRTVLSVARH